MIEMQKNISPITFQGPEMCLVDQIVFDPASLHTWPDLISMVSNGIRTKVLQMCVLCQLWKEWFIGHHHIKKVHYKYFNAIEWNQIFQRFSKNYNYYRRF